MEEQHSNRSSLLEPIRPLKHPKIKPLLHVNPRTNTIEENSLQDFLRSHSKISKALNSPINNPPSRQYIKHFLKILQTQSHPSSASYNIHPSRAFQNCYFSSKIKNLRALSSLKLELYGDATFRKPLKFAIKSLASLKELTDFQIRFIFYDLTDSRELHKLFKRLRTLKKLTSFSFEMVSCVRFKASDFKTFFSYLSKFTQLQALKLSFSNSIQDNNQCFHALIPALSSLKSLSQIDFNIGGIGSLQAENLFKLFMTLGNMKWLTDLTLGLEDCEIINKNPAPEPLSKSFQYLNASSIRKISLRPYIENESLVHISQALKKFTSLKILTLNLSDSQQITNHDMTGLSSALSQLVSLDSLTIAVSSYVQTRITVQSVASALKSLQNLVHLKLVCNGLRTTDHEQILLFSSSLKALKSSLKFLDLDFSKQLSISDLTIQDLAEAVKELVLLKHLSLAFNRISAVTSKGLGAISFAVQNLSNLSHLALSFWNNKGINDMSTLAHVLRHIAALYSVDFNFGRCKNLKLEGNDLKSLFDALREVNHVGEISLNIPRSQEVEEEVKRLKLKKSVNISYL